MRVYRFENIDQQGPYWLAQTPRGLYVSLYHVIKTHADPSQDISVLPCTKEVFERRMISGWKFAFESLDIVKDIVKWRLIKRFELAGVFLTEYESRKRDHIVLKDGQVIFDQTSARLVKVWDSYSELKKELGVTNGNRKSDVEP